MKLRPWALLGGVLVVLTGCGRTDRIQPPAAVASVFEVLARSLPQAELGQAYDESISLNAQPGAGQVSWSVVQGALPPGLTLEPGNASVRVTGVPVTAGDFAFRLSAVEVGGRQAQQDFSLQVQSQAGLQLVEAALPGAAVGQGYLATVQVQGGVPPLRWNIIGGALPQGVGLAAAAEGPAELIGVPEVGGRFVFELQVRDAVGGSDQAVFEISVLDEPAGFRIVTPSLSTAIQGERYDMAILAEGGLPPYTWQALTLPPGLSLQPVGTPATSLSGIAPAPGEYPVIVVVEDSAGQSAIAEYVLPVSPGSDRLVIITDDLDPGRVTEVYGSEILAAGGAPPYRWRVLTGSLPAGLFLSINGTPSARISGTPQVPVDSRFSVEVQDQLGATASKSFRLEVLEQIFPLQISTRSLPDGLEGQPYEQPIAATGGVPPYAWQVSSGSVPLGLSLAPVGSPEALLAGLPMLQGSFAFEVQVRDSDARSATRILTVDIAAAATPPFITTTTLPNARYCEEYRAQVSVSGGLGPYVWSVASGTLPPGLSLQTVGTPDTFITGMPQGGGGGVVTLQVQDSLGQVATEALTLQVDANPNAKRWAALVARFGTGRDVYLSDLCSSPPTPAVRASMGTGQVFGNFTALSPDGSKLAFIGDFGRSGVQELYVVDLSGATPGLPVSVHPSVGLSQDIRNFTWSPDSTKLAYSGRLSMGMTSLWVVDVSNASVPAAPRQVSSPPTLSNGNIFETLWSPDSRNLAFRGFLEVSGRSDLYVTTPGSTTGHVRVNTFTSANADVTDVVWSPDGQRLLYVADQDQDNVSQLYSVDMGPVGPGSSVRISNVGPSEDVQSNRVHFAFDGSQVAFIVSAGIAPNSLYRVRWTATGPAAQELMHAPLDPNRNVIDLLWSPTASNLVFVADRDTDNVNELFWVQASGPAVSPPVRVNLPLDPNSDVRFGPANLMWSFDGSWLAFIVNSTTNAPIEAFTADMRGAVPITRPVGPARTDANLDVRSLMMSRHTNQLAVVGNLVSPTNTELFHVDLSTGSPAAPVRVHPAFTGPTSGANISLAQQAVAFRPDGLGLLYIADAATNFVNEAWSVSLSNPGTPNRLHNVLSSSQRVERIIVP